MILRQWVSEMLHWLMPGVSVDGFVTPTLLAVIAIISVASYFLSVHILTPLVHYLTSKTQTDWDDDILDPRALKAFSQLAPAIILSQLLPESVSHYQLGMDIFERLTDVYIVYAVINLVYRLLSNVVEGFEKRDKAKEHNLSVVEGAVKLILFIIGAIIAVSILFNKKPAVLLTGLGASAAVLMLIFQDTIKGFVAGVQLTVNNMLKKDDWIVCDKAGANGEVQDIKLTTVKVRNWDNSIVTIHPYTLISDSFKNYQNMRQIGARRVARSILIDFESIRFLSHHELGKLIEDGFISEKDLVKDRREVNVSIFRKYLTRYLSNHPDVVHEHPDPAVFMMVRQLQPTADGLPLELYFFSRITKWSEFEEMQAELFDHVYAAVKEFHLRIFQKPSGADVRDAGFTNPLVVEK